MHVRVLLDYKYEWSIKRGVGVQATNTTRRWEQKQRSIGPQKWQRQLHDKNKMAIDEGIDVLTMKTKGSLDDKNKRTTDR
jgi:hypothetical protein